MQQMSHSRTKSCDPKINGKRFPTPPVRSSRSSRRAAPVVNQQTTAQSSDLTNCVLHQNCQNYSCDHKLLCSSCCLADTNKTIQLTRTTCVPTMECIPATTLQWTKCEVPQKQTISKCVPVPAEKNVTIKTTKAIPCKKKVPIERVTWEKKCIACTKIVEKKVLVPCTKTITIPSTKIVVKQVEVPDEKIEWVCKKYIDYEEVDDYQEIECEEKIKVPTWKMDEKCVEICQHEVNWVSKEVPYSRQVEVCRPHQKVYQAKVPVKKLVHTHEVTSQGTGSRQFDCKHSQVCYYPHPEPQCQEPITQCQMETTQTHLQDSQEFEPIATQNMQTSSAKTSGHNTTSRVVRQEYIVKQNTNLSGANKSARTSRTMSPLTRSFKSSKKGSSKSKTLPVEVQQIEQSQAPEVLQVQQSNHKSYVQQKVTQIESQNTSRNLSRQINHDQVKMAADQGAHMIPLAGSVTNHQQQQSTSILHQEIILGQERSPMRQAPQQTQQHVEPVACEKTTKWQTTKMECNEKNCPGVKGYSQQQSQSNSKGTIIV